ncbi:DUF4191 domain-containing protein [Actinocrinis puniceicyclus]|uniref:DUF4191 domain-containing protein n=1 Tax=Actinocrinis puniceicyclus TaxID=977794 RepID=A0A8J7WMP1_9ACTN|nr:DUF4191 domain-containing protein [Actinocrinis puniceicyclus]MBS2963590.1 DUF4191 domain-containing protein [Actinocrinis puniceicyclus]
MARNPSPEPTVSPAAPSEPPSGRLKQFGYAYKVTKQADPRLTPAMLAWGGGTAAVVFVLFFLLFGGSVVGLVFAILFALVFGALVALSTLSRRVQRSAYARIEGQPGAAAAVLEQSLKRGWTMTPAVQFNRQQDLVHRLIGRAGILLVGEGDPNRVAQLVATERKSIARYLGPDVEVDSLIVGDDGAAGQVPLSKLSQTLTKRGLRGKAKLTSLQVNEYAKRLAAIGGGPMANLPKGPIPRGGRIPRGNIR